MSRRPAVLRGRLRASGGAGEWAPPATLGLPRLPCGVPAAVGIGVTVYHAGRNAESTGWFPGVVSSAGDTGVVARFARTSRPSGRAEYTEPLSQAEVRQRLRLRAVDGGTPPPSRAACSRPYVEGDASQEVRDYRTLPNIAERQRNRARAEERAVARASTQYRLCRGIFLVQLASTLLNGSLHGVRYFVEMFSGPYRSLSCAVQQASTNTATVTVDINPDFAPDVIADLRSWSLWKWMLAEAACWGAHAVVYIPFHLHFSPPCTTFGRACHLHGRCGEYPGGFDDSAAGVAAVQCAFAIAYLIAQLLRHRLSTTYTVENPLRSRLWDLPFMAPILRRSVVLDVTYCMFGSDMRKATRFVCHPSMRFPWARLVPSSRFHMHYVLMCPQSPSAPNFNCCGAVVLSTGDGAEVDEGSRTYHHRGRACAFSVFDADIPLHLGGCLVRAAVAARGAAHMGDDGRAVPRGVVCKLAAEWEMEITRRPWRPALAFTAALLERNPDVASMSRAGGGAEPISSDEEADAVAALASLSGPAAAGTSPDRAVAAEAGSDAARRGGDAAGRHQAGGDQVAAVAAALRRSGPGRARAGAAGAAGRPAGQTDGRRPSRTRACERCSAATGARFRHFGSGAIVCWACLGAMRGR
jgi:hypothetical protein